MVEEYNENELKTYKEELLKEIKKQNKDFDFYKLIIIILLIALIGFYVFNFLYEEINKLEKRDNFFKCVEKAEENYSKNWDRQCKNRKEKQDCSLPTHQANQVEEWKKNEIEICKFLLTNNLL